MPSARHIAASSIAFVRAGRRERRARAETFLLDHILRRPIVYTDERNLRYVLYPNENAGAYLISGGNYEVGEVLFCEQRLKPGHTMLDVGGNIGLYALLAGKLVGPTGRVHAFEPEELNAARLRANITLNGLDNVSVFEAAVYSETGTVRLNVFDSQYNAWHSLGRPSLPDPKHPQRTVRPFLTREVPAVTLDDHYKAHGLDHVDLIKIDVEGAEVDALLGAQHILTARAVDALLFEVSLPQVESLGRRPEEAFELLSECGYQAFSLREDGTVGEPVTIAAARYANYVAFPTGA